jgi:hypothetical protein
VRDNSRRISDASGNGACKSDSVCMILTEILVLYSHTFSAENCGPKVPNFVLQKLYRFVRRDIFQVCMLVMILEIL